MKLWLLRPTPPVKDDDPWQTWRDTCYGFVIRAETEDKARYIAQCSGGAEVNPSMPSVPWGLAKYATCEELTGDGEAGVILKDFLAG